MARRRRPILAGIVLAAALSTACTAAPTPGTTPVREESVGSTAASTRGECLSGDLAESEFGPHLASSIVRVDTGEYFHFGVSDNAYDSCRDLSWIVLDGEIGDLDGTRIRPSGTVVFFHGTELADDHDPRLYLGVTSVDRQSDTEATITWRHRDEPHESTESLALDGSRLHTLSSTTPAQRRADVPMVDLHSPPIPSESGVPPHGNIHGGPFDAVLPAGRYRIPLTDTRSLLCDLGGDGGDGGVIADCYRDDPDWADNPAPNRLTLTTLTTGETGDAGDATVGRGEPPAGPWTTLPRNGYFRVGGTIVNLTEPDEARFGLRAGEGVAVTPDSHRRVVDE